MIEVAVTQGDVLLFHTPDGGAINSAEGVIQMTGGFSTALYLSLFGGNENDDGSEGSIEQWWGDMVEEDPVLHYRSRTQNILRGLPLVSGNLKRIKLAVERDTKWILDTNAADIVSVLISITGQRRLRIQIDIVVNGQNITTVFLLNWNAQALESK